MTREIESYKKGVEEYFKRRHYVPTNEVPKNTWASNSGLKFTPPFSSSPFLDKPEFAREEENTSIESDPSEASSFDELTLNHIINNASDQ